MRARSFRQGRVSKLDHLIFALRVRRLLANLPATARSVADLGSGHDAAFLRSAYRSGRILTGIAVDVSLAQSGRIEPAIQLVQADLSNPLPLPAACVDATTSLAVIEHLERPRVHVAEMYRLLRPGGTLLLTTPSRRARPVLEFMAYRLHLIDASEIRDRRHYYTEVELRSLLVGAGFADSDVTYRPFMLGMNQLIVALKRDGTRTSVAKPVHDDRSTTVDGDLPNADERALPMRSTLRRQRDGAVLDRPAGVAANGRSAEPLLGPLAWIGG